MHFAKTAQQNSGNILKLQDKYEECLICHTITNVLRTTDIRDREYYIYGAGQLCPKCYFEIYTNEDSPAEFAKRELI